MRIISDIVRQVSQRYFQKESDIKAFGFCDIIFVPILTAKAVYRAFTHIASYDISLVRSTNITEAHFLAEGASIGVLLFYVKSKKSQRIDFFKNVKPNTLILKKILYIIITQ